MSLTWHKVPEQFGIGFYHLDDLSEIIDAVLREGGYRLFAWTEDGETPIFRIHLDADFMHQALVLAEHFDDTAECEDVVCSGQGQAA